MMNTYFTLTAELNGEREPLFGSYRILDVVRILDVIREKRDEMHNYKQDGYKAFKIEAIEVDESASAETYPEAMTAHKFFIAHAPDFNFEMDEQALVELALEKGFISKAGKDKYIYTSESIDGLV